MRGFRGTPEQRFDAKYIPEPMSGCWLWTAAAHPLGYGKFYYKGGNYAAHRYAYERFVGEIPEGQEIDHKCRVPACVNPDHLRAVSHRLNTLLGNTVPAAHFAKTHCKNGHEFTAENTHIRRRDGTRMCKTCKRANDRRYATTPRKLISDLVFAATLARAWMQQDDDARRSVDKAISAGKEYLATLRRKP